MSALGSAEHQAERIIMAGTGNSTAGHPLGFAVVFIVGRGRAGIGVIPIRYPFGHVGRHVVNAIDGLVAGKTAAGRIGRIGIF